MNAYPPPLSNSVIRYLAGVRSSINNQYKTNKPFKFQSTYCCEQRETVSPLGYMGPKAVIDRVIAATIDELRLLVNNSDFKREIKWEVTVEDADPKLLESINDTLSTRCPDLVIQKLGESPTMVLYMLLKFPEEQKSKSEKPLK